MRGDVIGRSGLPGTYSKARPFNSRCLRTQTGRLIDARALSVAWDYPGGHPEREHEPCRICGGSMSAWPVRGVGRSFWFSGNGDIGSKVLRKDAVCRRWRSCVNGDGQSVPVVLPVAEHPTPGSLNRLTHEYEVKDDLDDAWAARPLGLVRERGQTILVLKDPGGEPIGRLIGPRMEIRTFLSLAVALSAATRRLHKDGRVQGHQADQSPCQFRDRPSLADRLWDEPMQCYDLRQLHRMIRVFARSTPH